MPKLRAVIYCRCSTEEESQVDALKKQVLEAKACVKENGWLLVDEYVESRSGTTAKGRQEYSRLFTDMERQTFDVIVIKSQDRLMRNTKDWYLFLDRMLTNGKRLYLYLDRKFYTTDDSLITGIKAILAEDYSRELSKKIVNAHRNRQKNGGRLMLTNQVYGFEKQADGSVTLVEDEAEIKRQMYRYCAAGYGCRTIENLLKEQGVRNRNGNHFSASAIRRIIRNPLNKGVFVMNKAHFDFETKRTVKNPPEEWVCQKGAVPRTVSDGLWDRANEAMTNRAVEHNRTGTYTKGSSPGRYLLSGKLVCGFCGQPYYRTWRHGYADTDKTIIEWKCSTYMAEGRKSRRRLAGRKIGGSDQEGSNGCDSLHLCEEIIFSMLEQACDQYFDRSKIDKEKVIRRTVQILRKAFEQNQSAVDLNRLDREEQRYASMKEQLLNKLLDGVITDEDYKKKNQELEGKLSGIRGKKEKCFRQEEEKDQLELRIAEIENRLETDVFEKATVARMLDDIDRIVVYQTYVELEYDPAKLLGLADLGSQRKTTIRLDYPFPARTEKRRLLDGIKVMELMMEKPEITAKEIAGRMGISVGMVRARILKLKEDGFVRFEGAGGHGKWVVLKGAELLRRQMLE